MRKTTRHALTAFAVTMLLAPETTGAAESGPARPNIIVILADDMGFSDLGCFGGEIRTPNLDRLAAEGLRFSQFYNCAVCGPSRAALMTGLHPHQVGISSWTGLLNNRCVTVFELLNRAGYATYAVGRLDMVTADNWHEPAQIARHVNRYFGSTGHQGPGNYFKAVRHSPFYLDGTPFSIPDGGYKTDLITEFATEFIRGADRSRPFFLYMAHYAPHWPLHAKPQDIARYRNVYRQLGWDKARQQRLERLVASGILPAGSRLAPRDSQAVAWEAANFKDWEAERMAVYAAQIDCLDQSVGRVRQALRDLGVEEQTLIFFLSDNGASDQTFGQLDKPGQTWRIDGTPTRVGNHPDIQPGPGDNFVTAGPAWSCLANTPFREHKMTNYEGGIASPLIAWWSQVHGVGDISAELSHIIDIPATILDVAGVTYPARFASRDVTPLAGKSLVPVLKGNPREGHTTLCWSTYGSRAVREGDWKLVSSKDRLWELYDLARDRCELDNVVEAHPERVARMAKIFEEWQGK
jgi:arylsulfatase A-like enzyme